MNESYHANEFYIRDIVGAAMYVIDELSIRSHIESLPAIVNEIWEVMGESGEAIRKSIQWIVQTVSSSARANAMRDQARNVLTPLFFHMLTHFSGQRVVQKSGGIHKRSR